MNNIEQKLLDKAIGKLFYGLEKSSENWNIAWSKFIELVPENISNQNILYLRSKLDDAILENKNRVHEYLAGFRDSPFLTDGNNDACPYGGDARNDCDGCAYSDYYHYVDGECIERIPLF